MPLSIIGAGLGRTGTASLRRALIHLEYPCYHMDDLACDRARRGDMKFWLFLDRASALSADWTSVFKNYRAMLDYPGCLYWRELMVANPRAKVLLTTHPGGAEAWYESTKKTIFSVPETAGASAFGRDMVRMLDRHVWGPEGFFQGRFADRDFAIARYRAHCDAVRREVPAQRLIDFDVTQGWAPICNALGIAVPTKPFPRINARDDKARTMRRLELMKRFKLGQPENQNKTAI